MRFVSYLLDEMQRQRICWQYKWLLLTGQEQALQTRFAAGSFCDTDHVTLHRINSQDDEDGTQSVRTLMRRVIVAGSAVVWSFPVVLRSATMRGSS